jgi:hypothetical protein
MTSDSTTLCGFRFDDDSQDPDLYTVLLGIQDDRPIISRGRVVFFTRLELAPLALEMDDDATVRSLSLPELSVDETYIYDLNEVYALIAREARDDSALLVQFLNVLLDLLAATRMELPPYYREALFKFANHMTIEREFASFLEHEGISREQVRDGIFWCIGAIASRLTILR